MSIIEFTKTYGDVGHVETLESVCPYVKAGTSVPVEFLKVKGAS